MDFTLSAEEMSPCLSDALSYIGDYNDTINQRYNEARNYIYELKNCIRFPLHYNHHYHHHHHHHHHYHYYYYHYHQAIDQ